jgi:hypothetical protein
MSVFINIALLVLILLQLGNSQESSSRLGSMYGPMIKGTEGGGIRRSSPTADIKEDTLRLRYNEAYALFSGSPFQKEYYNGIFANIKMKSIIRGDIDTTKYPSIFLGTLEKRCPNIKIDMNKDYLWLGLIAFTKDPYMLYLKCENILLDTPENRQKLIKEYEKMVIINPAKSPQPE